MFISNPLTSKSPVLVTRQLTTMAYRPGRRNRF
jgi:hypothetical protein